MIHTSDSAAAEAEGDMSGLVDSGDTGAAGEESEISDEATGDGCISAVVGEAIVEAAVVVDVTHEAGSLEGTPEKPTTPLLSSESDQLVICQPGEAAAQVAATQCDEAAVEEAAAQAESSTDKAEVVKQQPADRTGAVVQEQPVEGSCAESDVQKWQQQPRQQRQRHSASLLQFEHCEDVVNGCGWVRPKETAREEEKEIYKVKGFSADTMFVKLPLGFMQCLISHRQVLSSFQQNWRAYCVEWAAFL